MSFGDQLVLWLHIGFAIFTIGPLAVAISSTPRYIRKRDLPILRYLRRVTAIFSLGSLLVLIFGIVLGQIHHDFDHPWMTAAMTLFLVMLVLLALILRDQAKAIRALTPGGGDPVSGHGESDTGHNGTESVDPDQEQPATRQAAASAHVASVERGRIALMGGVVNLIWLAILALMVWQP